MLSSRVSCSLSVIKLVPNSFRYFRAAALLVQSDHHVDVQSKVSSFMQDYVNKKTNLGLNMHTPLPLRENTFGLMCHFSKSSCMVPMFKVELKVRGSFSAVS